MSATTGSLARGERGQTETYTFFDDAVVEGLDQGSLERSGNALPAGEEVTRVLETDGHAVAVSLVGPPPEQASARCRYARWLCTNVHEVVDLVLVGGTVRNAVGVRIDIVRVHTVASLGLGSLDPGRHDWLDIGQAGRGSDVKPPFVPAVHLVLVGLAQSGSGVVRLALAAVTGWVERQGVVPVQNISQRFRAT